VSFGVELEDVAASSVLDLVGLNSDDDLRVDKDWNPVAFDPSGEFTEELIPMIAVGTNVEIRAALDTLDERLQKAYLWKDDKSRLDYIRLNYLEETASQEVYRTVVGGKIVPTPLTAGDTWLEQAGGRNIYSFNLQLDVVPGWESPEVSKATGNLDMFGGQATLANSKGSRPARLGRVIAPPTTTLIGNMWLGIRDKREGLTDFTARQLFEDGSLFNGASLVAGGAPEYGTNRVEVDFSAGGESLQKRVTWTIENTGATTFEHMNGKYLILAKVNLLDGGGGGGVGTDARIGLQLRWGFGGSLTYNTEVDVTYITAAYHVVPLGFIQLPPWPSAQNSRRDMFAFQLQFWAERLYDGGGDPDLKLDAFVFMPTDHLFTMKVDTTSSLTPNGVDIMTREDWHHFAYGSSSVDPNRAVTGMAQSFQNWALPVGDSEVVLVSEGLSNNRYYLYEPGKLIAFTFYPQAVTGFPFET